MLESLRKDRIRKSGGKLVFHAEGEVEVDAQGVSRTIPNCDEVVDTDIFHGSMQRMRIQVVFLFVFFFPPRTLFLRFTMFTMS